MLPLTLAAGAAGLLLAHAAVRLLVVVAPPILPRLSGIGLDGTTVALGLLLSRARPWPSDGPG